MLSDHWQLILFKTTVWDPLPQLVPFLHSLNNPTGAPLCGVSLHLHAGDACDCVSEPGLSWSSRPRCAKACCVPPPRHDTHPSDWLGPRIRARCSLHLAFAPVFSNSVGCPTTRRVAQARIWAGMATPLCSLYPRVKWWKKLTDSSISRSPDLFSVFFCTVLVLAWFRFSSFLYLDYCNSLNFSLNLNNVSLPVHFLYTDTRLASQRDKLTPLSKLPSDGSSEKWGSSWPGLNLLL